MLGRLVALRLAVRVWSALALLCALVAGTGCIGGSTPYPPAIGTGTDAGGVRNMDGSAASDLGARDLGIDVDPGSDASLPADAAALDADLPDADAPDADAPDADLLDADAPDADARDADARDADLPDADDLDAAP